MDIDLSYGLPFTSQNVGSEGFGSHINMARYHKVPQGCTRYCKVAQGWVFCAARLVKKGKVA